MSDAYENVTQELAQNELVPTEQLGDVHNEQPSDDKEMEPIEPSDSTSETENQSVNDEKSTEDMEPVKEEDMEEVDDYITELEKIGASLLNKESKVVKATKRQKKRAFDVYDGEVFNPEGYYNFETAAEKKEKTYLELIASKNRGKVLEGQITGVQTYGGNGQVVALVQYKEFEVIIPATELMWIKQNTNSNTEDIEELYRRVKMRIGSTVSFIATYVDLKKSQVIASSIKAMGIKAFAFYVKRTDSGEPRIRKGMIVPGIVTCATSSFIIVESFGAEFIIREKELFWHRQDMVNNFYKVGDTVMYKVLNVEAGTESRVNGDIYKRVKVTGSVKQATKNPAEEYFDKYHIGQSQVATVTHIDENGVYCIMGTTNYPTMQVLCGLPVTTDVPEVGQTVTVNIVAKDDEKKFIYGIISPTGKGR